VAVAAGVGTLFIIRRIVHKRNSDSSTSSSTTSLSGGVVAFFRRRFQRDRKLIYVGRVTRLCLYPVKACNGVYVEDAYVGRDGLRLHATSPIRDRHWGILEIPTNHIVHLKYEQNFVCMTPSFIDKHGNPVTKNFEQAGELGLTLSAPGAPTIPLPVFPVARDGVVEGVAPEDVKTTIPTLQMKTMTETKAVEGGTNIDEWINKFVGKADPPRYRLMVKPAEFGLRSINGEMSFAPFLEKAKKTDCAAFQAVAPLQIVNEASVEDLNRRLLKKHQDKNGDSSNFKDVAMVNFRGNIIVDSRKAYEEDSWGEMWIAPMKSDLQKGEIVAESSLKSDSFIHMRRLAPCQRCTITQVDPETGKFRDDKEPLATLMSYRRFEGWGSAPVFGSYVGVDAEGAVKIGDAVFVTEEALPKPNKRKVQTFEKFWGRKV